MRSSSRSSLASELEILVELHLGESKRRFVLFGRTLLLANVPLQVLGLKTSSPLRTAVNGKWFTEMMTKSFALSLCGSGKGRLLNGNIFRQFCCSKHWQWSCLFVVRAIVCGSRLWTALKRTTEIDNLKLHSDSESLTQSLWTHSQPLISAESSLFTVRAMRLDNGGRNDRPCCVQYFRERTLQDSTERTLEKGPN